MPPSPAIAIVGPQYPDGKRIELGDPPRVSTSYPILQEWTEAMLFLEPEIKGSASLVKKGYVDVGKKVRTEELGKVGKLAAAVVYNPDGSFFFLSFSSDPPQTLHISGLPAITPATSKLGEKEYLYALPIDTSLRFAGLEDYRLAFYYKSYRSPAVFKSAQLPMETSMHLREENRISEAMIVKGTPMEPLDEEVEDGRGQVLSLEIGEQGIHGVLETPRKEEQYLDPESPTRARNPSWHMEPLPKSLSESLPETLPQPLPEPLPEPASPLAVQVTSISGSTPSERRRKQLLPLETQEASHQHREARRRWREEIPDTYESDAEDIIFHHDPEPPKTPQPPQTLQTPQTPASAQREAHEEPEMVNLDPITATPGTEIPPKPAAPTIPPISSSSTPELTDPGFHLQSPLSPPSPPPETPPKSPDRSGNVLIEIAPLHHHHHHHGGLMDDVDATGECDIPDSLPPAFHYREHMKLHTPAKTYGKRSRRREEEAGKLYVDSPKKEEGGGSGKRKRGQQSRSTTTPESAVKKRRGVKTLGMFSDARGGAGDKGKQEGSGSERRLRSGKKRA